MFHYMIHPPCRTCKHYIMPVKPGYSGQCKYYHVLYGPRKGEPEYTQIVRLDQTRCGDSGIAYVRKETDK